MSIKQLRKINILAIILIIGLLNCSSSQLNISEDEFKERIKKIVVVPIQYPSKFPRLYILSRYCTELNFDRSFEYELKRKFSSNADLFDNCVEQVFKSGKFKIDTISSDKEIEMIRDEDEYSYLLSKDVVNNLLKQHNADAIFFHYIDTYDDPNFGELHYISRIYTSDGVVLYSKESLICVLVERKNISNYKQRNKFQKEILDPEKLLSYFNKDYISYMMIGSKKPDNIIDYREKPWQKPFLRYFQSENN